MSEPYLKEINSIDNELRRLNTRSKTLRSQKMRAMTGLYTYMKSHNLEKVGEGKSAITIEKCKSQSIHRTKRKAKPKARKREDAIGLFRNIGIPDPETFYSEFEKTQKLEEENLIRNEKKRKNNDNAIDEFLGF